MLGAYSCRHDVGYRAAASHKTCVNAPWENKRLRTAQLPAKCYMNSLPQWVQVLKPTPAKLYCLQDGHKVTCVPQSTRLIESFDCHALRSRLGNFRGSDRMLDPDSKDPTIYAFSSSMARAMNP